MSSLTFGPGWLRALSGGDNAEAQSKPPGMKRFKLAEFRYGREEMLALFVDNAKLPKELKEFGDIILQETPSEPLSFIPLTEEEERCQVAGVNSAVVLRMSGRGAPPVRGRGAIRGARGRGRGEGQPGYYRSLSNEDGGFNNAREPYARRPWAEGSRGGSADRGAGRGDPSPGRGGFEPRVRIPSDRAGSAEKEPWRPGQEEDDGGGWRISGQRTWRKGSADASRNWRSDHSKEKEEGGDPAIARKSWNRSNSEKEEGGNYWRPASSSGNSGLPEWCDDDDDQDLGTFDSSGQFKSLRDQKDTGQDYGKNADATDSRFSRQESDPDVFDAATDKGSEDWDTMEEATKKPDGKTNRSSEMNDKSRINVNRDWDSGPPRGLSKVPDRGPKERNRMSPREAGQGPNNGSDQREQIQRGDKASKASPLPESEDSKSVPISVSELEKQLLSGNASGTKSVNTVNSNNIDDLTIDDVKSVAHGMRKILAESHMARNSPQGNDDEEADLDMDHIKNLIDKLDDENDDPFDTAQITQDVGNRNIDDPSIVFAKKAEPGVLIKGMQDWIYRDPQGEIQGPFSCEEMLQWFKAGYFTMGLLVRRVCDEIFLPLGDLIKLWNRVPFLPGREPPSVTSQVYAAQLARRQQQEQYILAQQQRKMQQQQQHQQQHQQIQQQQQQHELRLLQQMQEQQQMKDMQQRPHNLNVAQEVSIWGDSPAPSPNLASTPWSPSSSQPEPQAWNHSKSPTANLEEFRKHELEKERAEQLLGLETKKSSVEDLKRLSDGEQQAKGKPDADEKEPSDEDKGDGGLSPSDEELELADDDDGRLKEQNKKKSKGKKKKGANDKKKEEREKQQKREEEDRKALEALEKAQQEKMAIQKRKEEEERQKQLLMQQQQLKQQQQQQILQQQQQQQQQQLKHQQMLMQQQAMMQQEQRRLNVNEGPSWNVPTTSNAPSLAEIQRMEEERQMIIREKLKHLQAHEQQIQQQQRAAAGWAEKGGKPVASLRQIQEEEARQMLARQRSQVQQQQQQQQQQQPKGGHAVVSSSVWNSKNVQGQQNYGGYDSQGSASFWDDVMNLAPSLEASSQYQRSNSKSRVVSDSGFPSLNSGAKQNKKSKDEELVHRLFQQASPSDDFIQWVNKNMPGIAKFVDVPTFVSFLQDIDSPYEVHEYIRSYFGDNQDAQNFAREFLEWRKRNGRQPTSQYGPVSSSGMSIMSQNSDPAGLDGDDPTGRKKKQKKRMQKVNPSLLGFSCDADPGMVNRGEIRSSAMDAWNSK